MQGQDVLKWAKTLIALAIAAGAAFWTGLPFILQLLVYIMALDILSGVIAAFVSKELSSDVSFRGLAKKAMILLMVALAQLLGQAIGVAQLAVAVAAFYCVHEALSILENAAKAGLPIPDILRDALAKLSPEKVEPSKPPDQWPGAEVG